MRSCHNGRRSPSKERRSQAPRIRTRIRGPDRPVARLVPQFGLGFRVWGLGFSGSGIWGFWGVSGSIKTWPRFGRVFLPSIAHAEAPKHAEFVAKTTIVAVTPWAWRKPQKASNRKLDPPTALPRKIAWRDTEMTASFRSFRNPKPETPNPKL